ncbi:MAG: hypothetical protein WCN95_08000 [bacterium]
MTKPALALAERCFCRIPQLLYCPDETPKGVILDSWRYDCFFPGDTGCVYGGWMVVAGDGGTNYTEHCGGTVQFLRKYE